MNDVVDAVVEFANTSPVLLDSTAFGAAWLWCGRAPEGTSMPYGTIQTYSVTPTWDSGENGSLVSGVEAGTFNVSVYSTSRANCGRLAKLVRDVLADAPLAFSGGSLMHIRPGAFSLDLDPDPGPSGEDVWQAVLAFDVRIDTTP